jgi:hypothetical protein
VECQFGRALPFGQWNRLEDALAHPIKLRMVQILLNFYFKLFSFQLLNCEFTLHFCPILEIFTIGNEAGSKKEECNFKKHLFNSKNG